MNPSEYLLQTSREYAIYVCHTRAIPFVGDGLKHGQMIALWLLRHRAEKIKTIGLSGLMAYERLYVHGDASANNLIGMLAAPFKNNAPLIEGLGEFGSRVSPDAIGAPRYTEVRRARAAQALLYNDLDIIPLEDNYDGSNVQPQHFLPLIPLVLLNGISGIAVGWSTNILPRSLKSLIEATKQALAGQPIRPLPPHYERYDISVTSLGGNHWEFAGKVIIVNTSTVQITELPPGMNIDGFRKRLIEMEDAEQIVSYTDRSTHSIDIMVKLKRGAATNWTPQEAIDFFKLRERMTERIVVIDWDRTAIRTYDGPEQLVKDFVAWRLNWYVTRFEYQKRRDSRELTFWRAVKALFDDKFPKRLGGFADRAAMLVDVNKAVGKRSIVLDDEQQDRVVNLATYRWTQEFAAEVEKTIANLEDLIEEYETILGSPERLRGEYMKELDQLRKIA